VAEDAGNPFSLFCSIHGEVACEAHAPARTDPRWNAEHWDRVPDGGRFRCEHCHPASRSGPREPLPITGCDRCDLDSAPTGETRVVRVNAAGPAVWQWQVEYACPASHRRWLFVDIRIEETELKPPTSPLPE
jgi:hypothetical protein